MTRTWDPNAMIAGPMSPLSMIRVWRVSLLPRACGWPSVMIPALAMTRRSRSKLGPIPVHIAQSWPRPVRIGLAAIECGRSGAVWSNVGGHSDRARPHWAQIRSRLTRLRPNLSDLGHVWSPLARHRPDFGRWFWRVWGHGALCQASLIGVVQSRPELLPGIVQSRPEVRLHRSYIAAQRSAARCSAASVQYSAVQSIRAVQCIARRHNIALMPGGPQGPRKTAFQNTPFRGVVLSGCQAQLLFCSGSRGGPIAVDLRM